jgi:hypothetical protein
VTFAVNLRVPDGESLTAAKIKEIIAAIEAVDWSARPFVTALNDDFHRRGLFDNQTTIINYGPVTEFVQGLRDMAHEGAALIVTTVIQDPNLFIVVDDFVRAVHINFDFLDYARFQFIDGKLMILDLTDMDKTLLRLATQVTKHIDDDGNVVEHLTNKKAG